MKGFFCLTIQGNVHYGGEATAARGSCSQCTTDQKAESDEDHAPSAATFLFSPENSATPSEGFYHIN